VNTERKIFLLPAGFLERCCIGNVTAFRVIWLVTQTRGSIVCHQHVSGSKVHAAIDIKEKSRMSVWLISTLLLPKFVYTNSLLGC